MAMQPPPRRPAALYLSAPDRDRGLKLLGVEGDLATADAPRFGEALATAISEGGDGIVIDLRGCRFLAAACARTLIETSARLRERGGRGLFLVIDRGSSTHLVSAATEGSALPTFDSAGTALLALRESPATPHSRELSRRS